MVVPNRSSWIGILNDIVKTAISKLLWGLKNISPLVVTFSLVASGAYFISELFATENAVRQSAVIMNVALTAVLAHLYLRMARTQEAQQEILSKQTNISEADHAPILLVENIEFSNDGFDITISNTGKGIASSISYQCIYTPARLKKERNSAVPTAGYEEGYFRPPAMLPLERVENKVNTGGKNYLNPGERNIHFSQTIKMHAPDNPRFLYSFESARSELLKRGIDSIILQIQLDYSYQSPIDKRLIHAIPAFFVELSEERSLENSVKHEVVAITADHLDEAPFIGRGRHSREDLDLEYGPRGYVLFESD